MSWEMQDNTSQSRVVTVAEAKTFLQEAGNDNDTLIGGLIDSLQDWIEEHCGISLSSQSFTEYLSGGGCSLWLRKGPVTAVVSVTDLETSSEESSSNYRVLEDQIALVGGGRWLSGRRRWEVIYVAGYASVPNRILLALKQLIRRSFDNRGGAKNEGAMGWKIEWKDLMTSDIMDLLRADNGSIGA